MKKIVKQLLVHYLTNKPSNFKKISIADELVADTLDELNELKLETKKMTNAPDEMWRTTQLKALEEFSDPASLRAFLRLPMVQMTMYEFYPLFLIPEYFETRRYLKKNGYDAAKIMKETSVGSPIPFLFDSNTSGNMFHHLYHILQFIEHTGVRPENLKHIFEFGGGYGNMCRMLVRLGYEGEYRILDLPTFSLIQKFYLKAHHLINGKDDKIQVIQSSDGLAIEKGTLYLATWSLSETGNDIRTSQKIIMDKCDNFLIAYRDEFEGFDNAAFFQQYISSRPDVEWRIVPCKYIARSLYLFGSPKT